MNKENLIPLSSLQNFIDGLHDTENSKVYFKVVESKGHYTLLIYVDNNCPNTPEINGCRLWYRMEMNETGK